MLKPLVGGIWLCVAGTMAGAQSQGLSGQQISELVAGATVEIDTPTGTKLPVRYTAEGRLSGEARDLAWFLGSDADNGRWWVTADQLCHKWFRWFGGEPQCMRISREGQAYRWVSKDGNSGTARITQRAVAQASTLLALPRVFPKRVAEAAPEEAPPTLASPRQQASADPAPAPSPQPPPQRAAGTSVAEAWAAAPAPDASADSAEPAPRPPRPEESKAAQPQISAPSQKQADAKRAAQPLFKVANVRNDDVLNVRSGPSADFEVVAELPPGSRGIAITNACRDRWCPVQHDSASGWVNRFYLAPEQPLSASLQGGPGPAAGLASRDSPEAPRSCLTSAARALLGRIEQTFGPVQVISTCRPGALIAGTGHPSRHASGNAVDFKAGGRKAQIVEWLIANHRAGGTMTYADMDHIHVDIGPHFVSIAGGRHWSSWNRGRRDSSDD